jgi:AraC-like DNA-binding protein
MTTDADVVRAWRTSDHDRLLWIHGVTTSYRVDPVGEYVIGVTSGRSYHLQRGRSTTIVRPGQLVVLDPSAAHSGVPAENGPWVGRLLVIELPDLHAEVFDASDRAVDLCFPNAIIDDPSAARRFVALHHDMARPASTLERQSALTSFLDDLAARSADDGHRGRRGTARHDPSLRRALDYMGADITRNLSLEEVAGVAGVSKYQLVRRFKSAFGAPPHAFQISQRIALARRLLERGEPPTEVATLTGFVDQSHLHRHFRPRLGLTPKQYARAFGPRA